MSLGGCCLLNRFELFGPFRAETNGDVFHGVVIERWGLRRRRPGLRLAFERLVKSTLKSCELWVFFFQRSFSPSLGCGDIDLRRCAPVDTARHLTMKIDAFDVDRLDPFKNLFFAAYSCPVVMPMAFTPV